MAIYFAGIWFSFWKSGNTRNTKNYWLWIQAALLNPDILNSGIMVMFTSLVAQLVKNLPAMQETQVPSLGQEDPLEK